MLKNGKWSLNFDRCIKCYESKNPYHAKGLCKSCYYRIKYRNEPEFRRKIKEGNDKWRINNKEKYNELARKYQLNRRKKIKRILTELNESSPLYQKYYKMKRNNAKRVLNNYYKKKERVNKARN